MRPSSSTCRVEIALVSRRGTSMMRRPIAALAKGTMFAVLTGACVHDSASKQSDTLAAAPEAPAATDSTPPVPAAKDSSLVVPVPTSNNSVSEPLTCTPNTFGSGDTLTLRMRTPHGDYLTVTRTNGTVYFIVYPQWGKPRRRYSLIPSDDFRQIATLRLPSDVRAIVREVGRDTIPETVFTNAGKYLLRMGENLESDYGNPNFTCPLTFAQPSK